MTYVDFELDVCLSYFFYIYFSDKTEQKAKNSVYDSDSFRAIPCVILF